MRYYPIFIDMKDREVLVVGGGYVALQKIRTLLDSGAKVTIVTKELIAKKILDFDLPLEIREYREEDILGKSIVVSATNDTKVNNLIYKHSKKYNVLLNAVDDKDNCDYYLGAISKCGDITVSVSTGGKSPIVAKKVRDKIDNIFDDRYKELLEIYGNMRLRAYKELDKNKRKTFFKKLEEDFDKLLDKPLEISEYFENIKKGKS